MNDPGVEERPDECRDNGTGTVQQRARVKVLLLMTGAAETEAGARDGERDRTSTMTGRGCVKIRSLGTSAAETERGSMRATVRAQ